MSNLQGEGTAAQAASDNTSPGTVYVFNTYNDPMLSLEIGGAQLNPNSSPVISGWSGSTGSPYNPQQTTAPRAQSGTTGVAEFIAGQASTITVTWQNVWATFTITSPSTLEYGIQGDLLLYIGSGTAIMVLNNGRLAQYNGVEQVISYQMNDRTT